MLAELHTIGGLLTLINPTNHKGVAPYATKQFKITKAPAADMLRQVVSDAGRSLPPAMVRPDRRTVMVNVKIGEAAASALIERAMARD